jgi:hypothetical protein
MGAIHEPGPAKLFVGMLASEGDRLIEAEGLLVERFGAVDLWGDVLPFDYTDYYREEMGEGLKRRFLSFERLIRPDAIIDIKRATNQMEEEFARKTPDGPSRPVNLDPGYLTLSKVVLATTKDYAHRLYLGRGIYAEVTLHFHKGRYEPWEWTYPDYRTPEYGRFFLAVRGILCEQIKQR